MPKQEVFFEREIGDRRVEVLKTYDQFYAREVFSKVDDEAKKCLAAALEIVEKYAPEEISDPNGPDYDDFLWEELNEASLEDARQSPRLSSFFVVTEANHSIKFPETSEQLIDGCQLR